MSWMDRERLRRIRNWQSSEFYARLVMRPLTILIMLVVADWRWLTPNLVTTLGSIAKVFGAVILVADHRDHAVLAAVMFQVGLLLDHLDGTIARYRRKGTTFGDFYDKTSDAITWFLISGAVGLAAYRESGDVWIVVATLASAYVMLLRGYMKWLLVARRQQRARAGDAVTDDAMISRVATAVVPTQPKDGPPERSARDWTIWFLSSLARIVMFEEVDLFFWVGLGLVLKEYVLLVWVLTISQVAQALVMIVVRHVEARALDLGSQPKAA